MPLERSEIDQIIKKNQIPISKQEIDSIMRGSQISQPTSMQDVPVGGTPEKQPGFIERVGKTSAEGLERFAVAGGQAEELFKQGKVLEGVSRGMLGGAGGLAASGLSIVTEAAAPLMKLIGSGISTVFEKTGVASKPDQQRALELIAQNVDAWAKEHPIAAANLQDLIDLSAVLPELKAGQVAGKGALQAGKVTMKTTGKIAMAPIDILKGYASEGVKKNISEDVDSLLKATRSISKQTQLAGKKGTNISEILKDPQVFKGIKVEKAKIVPDEAISVVDSRIDRLMDVKKQMLPVIDDMVVPVPKSDILKSAVRSVTTTGIQTAEDKALISAIKKQVAALPETLKPSEIDTLRAKFRKLSRDAKGLMKSGSEYTALENATRDVLFRITDDLPVPNASEYKAMNDYIKQMITTRDFLDKTLRSQTVKGGRLGGYVLKTIGAIGGLGHGILGVIAGSEIGGIVADIITNNQLGSGLKMRLIRGLTNDPKIISQSEQLLRDIGQVNVLKRPALPMPAIRVPGRPDTSGIVKGAGPMPGWGQVPPTVKALPPPSQIQLPGRTIIRPERPYTK